MKEVAKNMSAIAYTLEKIISEPQKNLSKDEAQKILRNCGIIDHNGNITPAYSKIVTYKTNKTDASKNK